jgi:hypothetical protein
VPAPDGVDVLCDDVYDWNDPSCANAPLKVNPQGNSLSDILVAVPPSTPTPGATVG